MNKLTALLLGTMLAIAFAMPALATSGLASPKSVSFGRQVVNACNTETLTGCTFKTITLTNNTSSAIVNIGTQFSDAPSPSDDIGFGVQSNSCVTTLLPGQSCQIRLTANPMVLGKVRGSVLISSDGQFNIIAVIPVRTTGI